MKPFLEGGRLALGILLGVIFSVILILSTGGLSLGSGGSIGLIGTLVGASIAFAGQLIIVVNDSARHEAQIASIQLAKLRMLLARLTVFLSVFGQYRDHILSENPFDVVQLGQFGSFPKPFVLNDDLHNFGPEDFNLALELRDEVLANLMNAARSNISNFIWAHREYSKKMNNFMAAQGEKNGMSFNSGRKEGIVKISREEVYILKDYLSNLIESVYCGLVLSLAISKRLVMGGRSHHAKAFLVQNDIAPADLKELVDSVDLGGFEEDVRKSLFEVD